MLRKIELIKSSYLEKIQSRRAQIQESLDAWAEFSAKFREAAEKRGGEVRVHGPDSKIRVKEIRYASVDVEPNCFAVEAEVNRRNLDWFLLKHQNDFFAGVARANVDREIRVAACESTKQSFHRYLRPPRNRQGQEQALRLGYVRLPGLPGALEPAAPDESGKGVAEVLERDPCFRGPRALRVARGGANGAPGLSPRAFELAVRVRFPGGSPQREPNEEHSSEAQRLSRGGAGKGL